MKKREMKPGERYGAWITVRPHKDHGLNATWWCRCDCGVEKAVQKTRLRPGVGPCRDCAVKAMVARNKVGWTDEMVALLGTAGDRDVAKTLGLCYLTVWKKRKELGIPGRGKPASYKNGRRRAHVGRTKHDRGEIIAQLKRCGSVRALSEHRGISRERVYQILTDLGLRAYDVLNEVNS